MYRRQLLRTTSGIAALGVLGATPALGRGQGRGKENDRDNSRRSDAERVDLSSGDVVELTSDPDASNFDEEFTFCRVDHGVAYEESTYRGPARIGPDNVEMGGSSSGSFWFGVSAPDEDGIQHEVDHRGQEVVYMRDEDGDWWELRAQFTGNGELRHVNGVAPVSD